MKTNLGTLDRVLRGLAAAAFLVLILAKAVAGTLAVVLAVLGGIFLLTAAVGFCPLYAPFKLSTKKREPRA
jgi:uncharacterized membrane protein